MLELIREMNNKSDIQNIVGVNQATFGVKDEKWFPWATLPCRSLSSSLFTHIHNRRIDCIEYCYSIHKNFDQTETSPESADYGKTPLAVAIHKQDSQIVELLLKFGANPNRISSSFSNQNRTPLSLAIEERNAQKRWLNVLLTMEQM